MTLDDEHRAIPASRWALSLTLFSLTLLGVTAVLHRLLGLPTGTALNLFAVSFAGVVIGIVIALIALIQLWRHGGTGTVRALGSILMGLGLFTWPLSYVPAYLDRPSINDVTTDTVSPPAFVALAQTRERGANPTKYPGSAFSQLQLSAYPDLRPFVMNRPPEEAFDLVMEAMRRLKWAVVTEEPPKGAQAGLVEAVDRTPILGFYDDVAIRVVSDRLGARIDVRSASRFGSHDFGRNAQRVRLVMKELKARYEASVPSGVLGKRRLSRLPPGLEKSLLLVKRGKALGSASKGAQTAQDPDPPDDARGPRRKGRPQPKG